MDTVNLFIHLRPHAFVCELVEYAMASAKETTNLTSTRLQLKRLESIVNKILVRIDRIEHYRAI